MCKQLLLILRLLTSNLMFNYKISLYYELRAIIQGGPTLLIIVCVSIYLYIYIYIYIYNPTCLATLKSSDRTKQSEVEHSGDGIFGRHSHNAKLFERIEHSGSRVGYKNVNKQTLLLLLHKYLKNSLSQRGMLVGRVVWDLV